jgi:hypothetical protein
VQPRSIRSVGIGLAVGAITAAALVGSVQAHVLKDFGPYSVALGWVHEPTYVDSLNAVQVVVKDSKGRPVVDLDNGALKVVVSVGGQTSAALDLENTYDPDTGLGVPGDYEAPLVPTVPGDYTFHLTGDIHGTPIDETATSSDSTFDSAVGASGIQFPSTLPATSEIVTRLDRIDARVAALASPAAATPDPIAAAAGDAAAQAQAAAAGAQTTATSAHDAASTALLLALLVGGLGVVLGAAGVFLAVGARKQRSA